MAAIQGPTRETFTGDAQMKRGLAVRPRFHILVTLISHFDCSRTLTARMITP